MITLAFRALLSHKLRSAVLAGGFGLGVSVIANLLGIGAVMLEQAGAPALAGGGDLVVAGTVGRVSSARFLLGSVLDRPAFADRVAAAAPTERRMLFLVRNGRDGDGRTVPVAARGGIPSLERALGDDETAALAAWTDAPDDRAWTAPDPGDVLRAMDRFHPIPDVPARAESWAEWLYFNGRAGDTRFYLTFLVGPQRAPGRRLAGVRLQLDDGGRRSAYGETAEVDAARVLADAPDLVIGRSRVRLDGSRYRITLDLPRQADAPAQGSAPALPPAVGEARVTGDIVLDADVGRSLPPFTIRGARGWTTGYVVPVMSGTLNGRSRWVDARCLSRRARGITITTGATGKGSRGSGARWRGAASPSSMDGCTRRRMPPIRNTCPGSSSRSGPTVRWVMPPASRSTSRTLPRRVVRTASPSVRGVGRST